MCVNAAQLAQHEARSMKNEVRSEEGARVCRVRIEREKEGEKERGATSKRERQNLEF